MLTEGEATVALANGTSHPNLARRFDNCPVCLITRRDTSADSSGHPASRPDGDTGDAPGGATRNENPRALMGAFHLHQPFSLDSGNPLRILGFERRSEITLRPGDSIRNELRFCKEPQRSETMDCFQPQTSARRGQSRISISRHRPPIFGRGQCLGNLHRGAGGLLCARPPEGHPQLRFSPAARCLWIVASEIRGLRGCLARSVRHHAGSGNECSEEGVLSWRLSVGACF